MALLLVGAALLGAGAAANSAARFAATDLAVERHRARALSTVVWATTIGAVAGPNLSGPSGALADVLGIPELTGPFALGTVGLLLAALVLAVRLRPDPLLLAREAARAPDAPVGGAVAGTEAAPVHTASWRRTVAAIQDRPVLGWAVAGLAGGHAAMVGVMIMTPLHMEHGGADLRIIGVVVSVHVLGMFAFSPLVGSLTDRLGRPAVLGAGGLTLLVSLVLCAASPEGSSARIFAGLFLLGLGWSCTTVAGSTIIADHAPLEARTDVQGSADLVMGLTAAFAGGLAGLVTGAFGYPALALGTVALALLVLLAAARARGLTARAEERLAELPS
jgi:MFS family permease